ncbi:hypothetical protein IC229_25355 [Spirosoma sp. BT702]|uniref:Uncharacterized protein n=1 Tax=Spirosoma profusum TaxID=2771354 RepID=A0A926Y3E7_9BACT|nr:hypothetical protein [Spirosoma profusum]MBD2703997.1 hypothetical protein [Spirosoma profusum]
MKKQLMFCAFLGTLSACQQEGDIQPSLVTTAGELDGMYQTNFFLDPSNVAAPIGQLPYIQIKAETDSNVTITYTKASSRVNLSLNHVIVIRQNDGVLLRLGNTDIGTLQTDRVFTNNGMEKQGKLLRLNYQIDAQNSLNFTGSKE